MNQEKYYTPLQNYTISIIGAGGIINDAHLPAYQIAGYKVKGIYDVNKEKSTALALKFAIEHVYESLEALIESGDDSTIYDIALPATEIINVLKKLPNKATVLIQKPMGNNYQEAQEILKITREKQLLAAVNFQLRYAPFINAARSIFEANELGEICDFEVYVNVHTPWDLWSFMKNMPRIEILYHSIHYVDLIRSFLGNPSSVYAKTLKHPHMKEIASVRTNIIMDYGEMLRANILTNHCHSFGYQNQESYIKLEGTKGAIKISLGVLIDYPRGVPDKFQYILLKEDKAPSEWEELKIEGGWFPHAFIGSMAQLMMAKDGVIEKPNNTVEDAIHTMACVEAAYLSSQKGGVSLDEIIQ